MADDRDSDQDHRPDHRPDLGLFGPDSVTWRVHAEPVLMIAGLRSLFLQALHPRAIAGVVQNSGYKGDPWGRLLRTINYVATVVYGTTAQANAAGQRVRDIHSRLNAVDPRDGEPFRLDEPELLRWVHVTEVESFLDTARRSGVPLTESDVDTYYTEQRQAAALVGLDPASVPGTAAQVADYYRAIRPELAMTKDAAETITFLLVPPLPWNLGLTPARLVYSGVAANALGLLPRWARRMYGLPGLPTTDLSASLSAKGWRLMLGALPRRVFEGPIYKSAMARAAAARAAAQS
jgi:uncharacterized protein (DUF2236 family)